MAGGCQRKTRETKIPRQTVITASGPTVSGPIPGAIVFTLRR